MAGEPEFRVADLVDTFSGPLGSAEEKNAPLRVLEPGLRSFGGRKRFYGKVVTLQLPDSHNSIVSLASAEPGEGRIMVVDNAASMRAACLGDAVASRSHQHGWAGIVVNGCIRDIDTIATVDIGCLALGTNPQKPGKGETGVRGGAVTVQGVVIHDGDWLYADTDGVIVSREPLDLTAKVKKWPTVLDAK